MGQDRRRQLAQDEISELIYFIYGELYPSAYSREYGSGPSEDTAIAGFEGYIKEVCTRVQKSIEGKRIFWNITDLLSREAKRLLLFYGKQLDELGLDV